MESSKLLLDVELLNHLNLTLAFFFFAFAGSFLSEVRAVFNGTQKRIKIYKEVIGAIFGLLIFYLIKYKFFDDQFSVLLSALINILCGTLGYEVYMRSSSLENIKSLIFDIRDIFLALAGINTVGREDNDKKESNDDKK